KGTKSTERFLKFLYCAFCAFLWLNLVTYVEAIRCQRIVAVHEGEQKVLARSHRNHAGTRGRVAGACEGVGDRSFYLHSLLNFQWLVSSEFPPSIMIRLRVLSSTEISWPPRRKNASRASNTIIVFRYTRLDIVCAK